MSDGLGRTLPNLARKPRILVCAPSNAATDELLQRIMDHGFLDFQVTSTILALPQFLPLALPLPPLHFLPLPLYLTLPASLTLPMPLPTPLPLPTPRSLATTLPLPPHLVHLACLRCRSSLFLTHLSNLCRVLLVTRV